MNIHHGPRASLILTARDPARVRVFIFVCCLVFFVVWTFRLSFFLLFGLGRVLFFAVWAGAQAPAQTAKKKKKHPPLSSVFCFAVWAGCFFFFCCLGGGGGGRGGEEGGGGGGGGVFFFCCLGGVVFFFAVWAGGVIFFLLFGRGTGVHSLTGLPGSSLSDPTTKKTKQQKKNTGSDPASSEGRLHKQGVEPYVDPKTL